MPYSIWRALNFAANACRSKYPAQRRLPLKSTATRETEQDWGNKRRCYRLFLESRRDGRGNGSVHTSELSADESHSGNAHHRYKGARQAILDDCHAGFVSGETSENVFHGRGVPAVR